MEEGVNSLIAEIEEDLRRERAEKLWKEHGRKFIATALAAILATAGISGWKEWHTQQEEKAASALFNALGLEQAAVSPQDGADRLAKMADQYPNLPQATVARMLEAGLRLRAGDKAGAIRIYESVASDAETARVLRDLAILFAVELQIDSGDPIDLQRRLESLQLPESPWRFSAWEFGSLLAARRGDLGGAKIMLDKILADPTAPKGIRLRAAEMMRTYQTAAAAQPAAAETPAADQTTHPADKKKP